MSILLSPVRNQELDPMATDTSPMVTNMTPVEEPEGNGSMKTLDSSQRYEKPPPLHTGADWKVVLHLPEIETWLRMTSERVRDLTHSVQQDADNRHVDVHLVQLKDICEDISDHVELIHALLETEISLKLLSYSVNVLVDIHTVQLLWHQLRVSVLVLRERILQGLQDSNGNYTRQTDILQAFSEERKETCLDSLTEVDDSGQLTIKCSQDYLSLDCGITAFELSDYSPSEDLPCDSEAMTSTSFAYPKSKSFGHWNCVDLEKGIPELVGSVGLLSVVNSLSCSKQEESKTSEEGPLNPVDCQSSPVDKKAAKTSLKTPPLASQTSPAEKGNRKSFNEKPVTGTDDLVRKRHNQVRSFGSKSSQCESLTPKRSIKDCFNYNEESPTQPSLPKRALYLEEKSKDDMDVNCCRTSPTVLSYAAEMSKSTSSLLDTPDKSKLWLDLASAYPSAASYSYTALNNMGNKHGGQSVVPFHDNSKKRDMHQSKSPDKNQTKSSAVNGFFDLHKGTPGGRSGSACTLSSPQYSEESIAQNNISPVFKPQNIVSLSRQASPYQKESQTIVNMDLYHSTHTKSSSGEKSTYNGICNSFNSQILAAQSKDSHEQVVPSAELQKQELDIGSKSKSPERESTQAATIAKVPSHTHESSMADSLSFLPTVSLQQQKRTASTLSPSESAATYRKEIWFGSDEYLALPSHLKETELLALKLENVTKLLSHAPKVGILQNIDDWELSEANSISELCPPFHTRNRKEFLETGTISPSSSGDVAPSIEDSIESGPLSDILSDDELSITDIGSAHDSRSHFPHHWLSQPTEKVSGSAPNILPLFKQLQEDIQHQENSADVWGKIEGFVNKLDELINWLYEALETTENWTPPKADTDSLKLYLETHLSFKLNVDSHCALKDAVVEEGQQLLELIESQESGLKGMLQMITSQWQELQRQIKRQHSWILRALDIIKAEILATDVTVDCTEGPGCPKGEIQLINLETRRDAVEQMSLKLYSEQYTSSNKRTQEFAALSKVSRVGSNSLLDFESEHQELWDWLIDMESIVMDSHDLMMSEEQQQHLYKGYSMEMSIWLPKKIQLLNKVESLKQDGSSLSSNFLEKVEKIKEKWDLLEKTLGEKTQYMAVGPNGAGPRDLLSPESSSLVRQLEVRIKELKGWMRDTELFIFNSCLLQEKEGTMDTQKKLQYFKSLCSEIKQRRRGIISVLRLCQRLLDDTDACCLDADRQSMQLIIVNLERRWEAIIMQAVQWQNRLQRQLGKEKISLSCIEPGSMDLNVFGEDSLEWDETDMSNNLIGIQDELPDLACEQNSTPQLSPEPLESIADEFMLDRYSSGPGESLYSPGEAPSSSGAHFYQTYNLQNVQFYGRDRMTCFKNIPELPTSMYPNSLVRSKSKDSSFSSIDSLPDLLGGLTPVKEDIPTSQGPSESESGIVSEGDTETATNSETSLPNQVDQSQIHSTPKPLHPLIELKHKDCLIRSCICKRQGSVEKKEGMNSTIKQRTKNEVESTKNLQSLSMSNEGNLQPLDINKITPKGISNDLEAQYDVFTFYDYSYLQGPELELTMTITHSPEEKATDGSMSSKPHSAEYICKNKLTAPESKPDCSKPERSAPAVSVGNPKTYYSKVPDVRVSLDVTNDKEFTFLSQGSSVESFSIAGDIFQLGPSSYKNECLQRSASLESWTIPYKGTEELFSHHGSGDISMGSDSVGELSKRTLDLLKRLENIQTPVSPKMKRSISDITLQSNSQKMSFTGQLSLDAASSVNEDSAASLTELSSSEELSLCSEDIVVHKNEILDSNALFKKHTNHSVTDEADVNISMIVNVSCTSACTDEEDDSDLLSSSTLTLTEEELHIKDDDDSSIATDDEITEESNNILDGNYMKSEFHQWLKPNFSVTKEKKKLDPGERVQCRKESSTGLSTLKHISSLYPFLNNSGLMLPECKEKAKSTSLCHRERHFKQTSMAPVKHFCTDNLSDDVENGNVAKCPLKSKKELRVLDSKRFYEKEEYTSKTHNTKCSKFEFSSRPGQQKTDISNTSYIPAQFITQSPQRNECHACFEDNGSVKQVLPLLAFDSDDEMIFSGKPLKYDVGVLDEKIAPTCENKRKCQYHNTRAELLYNCQGDEYITNEVSAEKSDAILCSSHHKCENKQLEEANKDDTNMFSSCICHSDMPQTIDGEEDSSVHNFVMEIIDMASSALKNISQHDSDITSPTSVAQIKEKVLEHSHRPLQLRKGDFYSYLSISSHDSDCGEVNTCIDEKSTTPLPLDFSDEFRPDNNAEDGAFLDEDFEEKCSEDPCVFSFALQKEAVLDRTPYSLTQPISFSDRKTLSLPNDRLEVIVPKVIHATPNDQKILCEGNLIKTNKISRNIKTLLCLTGQVDHKSEDSIVPSLECHIEAPYINPLLLKNQMDNTECSSDDESIFSTCKIEMPEPNYTQSNIEETENRKSVKQPHEMRSNLVKDTQLNDSHFEKTGDNLFISTKIQFPQHGYPEYENCQDMECEMEDTLYKKEKNGDCGFDLSQEEIPSSSKFITGKSKKAKNSRTTGDNLTVCASHHSESLHDSHAARSVPKRSVAEKQDQRQRNLAVSLLHFCPPIPKVASNLIQSSSSSLISKSSSFQMRVFHAGVIIWLLLLILCMAVAITPLFVIPSDCSKVRLFSSSWTPVLSYLQGPPPF